MTQRVTCQIKFRSLNPEIYIHILINLPLDTKLMDGLFFVANIMQMF